MKEITIHKPFPDGSFSIREKTLIDAIDENPHKPRLKVILPDREVIINPYFWMNHNGIKMKKVFLYKDNPMILWRNKA